MYIQEAHPTDAWQTTSNETDNVLFADPRDYESRANVAGMCAVNLHIDFPAVVDTMDNRAERDYTAWPDRIYVVDRTGTIAYKSAAGPFGFSADELSRELERLDATEHSSAS